GSVVDALGGMALVVGGDIDLPVAVPGSTGVVADERRTSLRCSRQRESGEHYDAQQAGEYANCSLFHYWIQTVLMFTNSRIPCTASSRPWPEYFTPPKGKRGSDATILFKKTIPASSSLMNLSVSAGSFVQALAPNPK